MSSYQYGTDTAGLTLEQAAVAAGESQAVIERHWDYSGIWTHPIELIQTPRGWGWTGTYTILIPDSPAPLLDTT